MNIAIATAASPDYADLAAVTNPTRQRYAEKHGYGFFFGQIDKNTGDACKRDIYEALWGKGYDLFVWMDLDSIIWNPTIRIEEIVTQFMGEKHFLWGWDHAGPNSGVYFVRFTSEARQFMDRSWATMIENGWADETAMESAMLIRGLGEYVATCPGFPFNAYPKELYYGDRYAHRINQLGDDSLVLHLPGIPNEKRIPLLENYTQEALRKWPI